MASVHSVCVYFVLFTRLPVFVFANGITRFVFKVLAIPLRGHWPYIYITYEHTYQFYDKGMDVCICLRQFIFGTVAYKLNAKYFFWFSPLLFVRNVSRSKKNLSRYYRQMCILFQVRTRYSCQTCVFSTSSTNTSYHEHPSSRSRAVSCGHGQTWRR
jgi:hypothetical protein